MRKLTLLFVALFIAFYGPYAMAGVEPFAVYVLRDGLLLLVMGALLFAANSSPLPPLSVSGLARQWPKAGWILMVTAFACGLVAAAIYVLAGTEGQPASIAVALWLVGIALFVIGVWWPGGLVEYSPPAYRWDVDAAGRYVRRALATEANAPNRPNSDVEEVPARVLLLPLLLTFAIGVVVRLWRLAEMPPTCMGAECVQALRLVEGAALNPSLYSLLTQALFRLTGDGVYSLRLAGALMGTVTLPLFFWTGRSYTRATGAVLATLLLALSPWHIWTSRTSDPWIMMPLLATLALATTLQAWKSLNRQWWGAAGVAFGLLVAEGSGVGVAGWLWLLAATGLGFWSIYRLRAALPALYLNGIAYPIGAVVAAFPVTTAIWRDGASMVVGAESIPVSGGFLPLATSLLYGRNADTIGYFLDNPLLSSLTVALVAVGAGRLLRYVAFPHVLLTVSGLLLFGVEIVRMEQFVAPLDSLLLVLLPFLFIAVAVAADELLWAFNRAWHVVFAPPRVFAVVVVVLLIVAGWRVMELMGQLGTMRTAERTSVDVAMGRYLARCLTDPTLEMCSRRGQSSNDDTTESVYYVPPSVLNHPSTRLLLGDGLDSEQVQALDIARDIPPSGMPVGDLVYLVPIDDQPVIDLLQQLYPAGQIQAHPQESGPTSFVTYRILRENILNRQGLLGSYYQGSDYGQEADAVQVSRDGPLTFQWEQAAPLTAPFSVLWEGSLLVPAAGTYGFSVDLDPGDAGTQPFFTLQLGDSLVLDTALGLVERLEPLAQGFYHFTMRYRTDTPPTNWSVRWQPPNGETEVIPREVLYSPALPDVGLIGTYYAGDRLQGPTLASRKDLVLGTPIDLPLPFGVVWRGKLAAPRAGEYLFAVTGSGAIELLINGRQVLNYLPDSGNTTEPQYVQSSIYLPKDWHDIEIRYIPQTTPPEIRILWQPPGSSPARLLSRYMRPVLADVQTTDLMLPEPPVLLDERLGDSEFALSYTSDLYQLDSTSPAQDLPPLLLELVWQINNGCGDGREQLNSPHGVAIDADGRAVYVADTGNLRVVEYALDEGIPRGDYSSDQFEEPVDVEISAEGFIVVLDAAAQYLFEIQPSEATISRMPLSTGFYRPRGFSIDALGNVLVADTGGGRVAMVEPMGGLVANFGGAGTQLATGQPVDTLFAGDKTWAVTAEDGRLWQLENLASLTAIPRANTLDGPHLAGLPDGSFFLSDPVRRTVLYHAASGQPLRQFAYPDVFFNPTGVGAALDGEFVYLAVADSAICTLSFWRTPAALLAP